MPILGRRERQGKALNGKEFEEKMGEASPSKMRQNPKAFDFEGGGK